MEEPSHRLFVSTFEDVSRYTYYDDLMLPGSDVASAWVLRDLMPTEMPVGVPEPSTLLLFGSALALLQVVRLRRKNRSVFPEPE